MASNIEDELRSVMEEATRDAVPPCDLIDGVRRRRRARRQLNVAGAGVLAAAVIIGAQAVAPAFHQAAPRAHSRTIAGSEIAGQPSPPALTLASPAANALDWVYRGNVEVERRGDIDARAVDAWSAAHNQAAVTAGSLWGARLPSGLSVLIIEVSPLDGRLAHTVVYLLDRGGNGRLVRDNVLPRNTKLVSQVIPDGNDNYVVALLSPTFAGQISYRPDGQRPLPAMHLTGFTGPSTGWAIYHQKGPVSALGRLQVRDCATCNNVHSVPTPAG